MTKSTHSTARRRPATGGTAETPANPVNFIDPTTLPAEYAMRVRGDCLAPAIKGGDSVLVDQRQPYAAGDLVCVFLKPECVAPGCTNVGLKRIVMKMMPGVTYPYQAHPDSNIMPVLVCEQDNPPMQYTIPADQILAIHRCMGRVPDDVALYDDKTGEPEYRRAVSAGWSRRELLAGAITVVPAAGLPALPALASDADAALFSLEPVFNEANERWRASMDVRAAAEHRYIDAKPPSPEQREMPDEVRRAMETLNIRQLRMLPDWHFVNVWFSEGSAATKTWADECERLHDETGLSAAESVEYDRMCEVDAVLRQIMEIRARTVEGLRLKVRVTEAASFDPEELLPSLIADIEAMAGGQEARS